MSAGGKRDTQPGFPYEIVYSGRKTLAIEIRSDGTVLVRAPQALPEQRIEVFLREKQEWILSHRERALRQDQEKKAHMLSMEERETAVQFAAKKLAEKTAYYAARMGVAYGKITIREQKSRWGSCSSAGNLNYNWKLVLMPEKVMDYVVIHELAHRREMNHSKRFYRVVEQEMPDYRIWQSWLREHGREY